MDNFPNGVTRPKGPALPPSAKKAIVTTVKLDDTWSLCIADDGTVSNWRHGEYHSLSNNLEFTAAHRIAELEKQAAEDERLLENLNIERDELAETAASVQEDVSRNLKVLTAAFEAGYSAGWYDNGKSDLDHDVEDSTRQGRRYATKFTGDKTNG